MKEFDFTKPDIDFTKYLIDLSEPLKEIPPMFSIGGSPVFSRGEISMITGKAKSRKSFLITLLASRMLDEDLNLKILLIDTEQNKIRVAKSAKRIHKLLEWDEDKNNDRLKVCAMRELTAQERLEITLSLIEKLKPDFIFIDGCRDLIIDFNSLSESSDLIQKLMSYSTRYNCHICSVLHENPMSDKTRGHLGTEFVNKIETALRVVANGNVSTVSGSYTKNKSFDDFHFCVNESGLPEYCEPEEKPKNNDRLKSLFNELLPTTCCLSYSDLRERVIQKTEKAKQTAERYIKDAVNDGIIIKNAAGLYYSFLNNESNATKDEILPF